MKNFKIALYFILCILLQSTIVSSTNIYVLSNEKVVYSFQSSNGKFMYLNVDTNNLYLVYRFGTKNKIELEYPKEKNKSSFSKFEYSTYFRPYQKGAYGLNLQIRHNE